MLKLEVEAQTFVILNLETRNLKKRLSQERTVSETKMSLSLVRSTLTQVIANLIV